MPKPYSKGTPELSKSTHEHRKSTVLINNKYPKKKNIGKVPNSNMGKGKPCDLHITHQDGSLDSP